GVFDNDVAGGVHIDAAVGAGAVVALDAVVGAADGGVDARAVARAISVEAAVIVEDQALVEEVDAVAHITADGVSADGAARAGRDAVTAVGVRGAFRDDGPGRAGDAKPGVVVARAACDGAAEAHFYTAACILGGDDIRDICRAGGRIQEVDTIAAPGSNGTVAHVDVDQIERCDCDAV